MKVRSLFSLIAIASCTLLSAQVTYSVVDYGAMPNDAIDDRSSIQATIDAVDAAGGGTVFFPVGTFLISPVPDPEPIQTIALRLKPNITLQGAGRDVSTIRMMDNAIPYDAMIGVYPSYVRCDSTALIDLTIDGNGLNNLIPNEQDLYDSGSRTMFRMFIADETRIERCRFTGQRQYLPVDRR
jgi:hypothetical protein